MQHLSDKKPCERDFTLEDPCSLGHDIACLQHSLPCPDVCWPGDIGTCVMECKVPFEEITTCMRKVVWVTSVTEAHGQW